MVVGTHSEGVILSELHEKLCFGSVCIPIRMRTIFKIRIIPVQVNAIDIIPSCTSDGIVTTIIGAIRIGIGTNEDIKIIHDGLHQGICCICQQVINKAKHQYIAGAFVSMHGGTVEEFRFPVGLTIVKTSH